MIAAACSSGGPAASIDGFDVAPERISELHPADTDLDEQQQAS